MLNKLGLYFRTLRKLSINQFFYLIKYRFFGNKSYSNISLDNFNKLNFFPVIDTMVNYVKTENSLEFEFINKKNSFKNIDWNYSDFGKLWNYNLNYFEYINYDNTKTKSSLDIIYNFKENYKLVKSGLDPYPTSLRIINLIKFINKNQLFDDNILFVIKNDVKRLINNIEYNLQANHLLENSFALFFASTIFKSNSLISFSKKLLLTELKKQITSDGAHYELSPMYHNLILQRLLELISLLKHNKNLSEESTIKLLIKYADKMLGWANKITISKKNIIPQINDSVQGICHSIKTLNNFAGKINISSAVNHNLSDSGFRIMENEHLRVLIDISEIVSKNQPAHSHADTFNFLLQYDNNPIIVDPGISTYEKNKIRLRERSTSFHNTVLVEGQNNNEVWSSFRVGRIAKVNIIQDSSNQIIASHNGYNFLGITHKRCWSIVSEKEVKINDFIISKSNNNPKCYANFHFYPETKLELTNNGFLLNKKLIISFANYDDIVQKKYEYCLGFNNRVIAPKITVKFSNSLTTSIKELNEKNIIS